MSDKFKLTDEEINKTILHSPYALADNPSQRGLGAAQIKKYFYDFIYYLADKLNLHLGDIGTSCEELSADIGAAFDQIATQGTDLEAHKGDADAHMDIRRGLMGLGDSLDNVYASISEVRDIAEIARSLATGKSKVYWVPSAQIMLYDILDVGEGLNSGDVYVILEKNVPEFAVLSKNTTAFDGAVIIQDPTDEVEYKPGQVYFFAGFNLLAMENGVDTSALATKEEISALTEEVSNVRSDMELLKGDTGSSGKLKLLKSVTIEEDVFSIEIDLDKPVDEIFITLTGSTTGKTSQLFEISMNNKPFVNKGLVFNSTQMLVHARAVSEKMWMILFPMSCLTPADGASYNATFARTTVDEENVSNVKIETFSTTSSMAAGFTVEIYGHEA